MGLGAELPELYQTGEEGCNPDWPEGMHWVLNRKVSTVSNGLGSLGGIVEWPVCHLRCISVAHL